MAGTVLRRLRAMFSGRDISRGNQTAGVIVLPFLHYRLAALCILNCQNVTVLTGLRLLCCVARCLLSTPHLHGVADGTISVLVNPYFSGVLISTQSVGGGGSVAPVEHMPCRAGSPPGGYCQPVGGAGCSALGFRGGGRHIGIVFWGLPNSGRAGDLRRRGALNGGFPSDLRLSLKTDE